MEMGHGVSCKLIFIKIFEVNFGRATLYYTVHKDISIFYPSDRACNENCHVLKMANTRGFNSIFVFRKKKIPFLFGGGHWVKRTWITQRHKQTQSALLPRFRAQNTNPYVMLV
jgi:hypothetical protein